jgi:hypothetical protein
MPKTPHKVWQRKTNMPELHESKRQCEGYNQRLVFKDPLNAYRPSLSAALPTLQQSTQPLKSNMLHFQHGGEHGTNSQSAEWKPGKFPVFLSQRQFQDVTLPDSGSSSLQRGTMPVLNSQRSEWKLQNPAPLSDYLIPAYLPENQTQIVDERTSSFDVSYHENDYVAEDDYSATLLNEIPDNLIGSFEHINVPNMLSTYVPSSQASPLRDTTTARIFSHFINVVGPSISMFERHPANPSILFQGQPVHESQQHLWTCKYEPRIARLIC